MTSLGGVESLLDVPTITGRVRAAHRDAVEAGLESGTGPFVDALERWTDFVRRHHGDVFASQGEETPSAAEPVRDAFADLLFYDFVAWSLLRDVTRTLDLDLQVSGVGAASPSSSHSPFEEAHQHASDDVPWPWPTDRTADVDAVDPGGVGELHELLVSKETRRAFGTFYTPPGLAELAVDSVADDRFGDARVLDPGCGAGTFLVAAIERKRAMAPSESPARVLQDIRDTVLGIELDPTAVTAARLAYVLAVLPLVRESEVESLAVPVWQGDALGLSADSVPGRRDGPAGVSADVLLGNPPWLTWDRLAARTKRRWREGPIDRLSLFAYRGAEARLGYGNDDISVPYAWTVVDRYLETGGRAAFVLKRTLVSGPAGVLLRTQRVGDRCLRMTHVHDFGDLRPFGGAVSAGAAVYSFSVRDPDSPVGEADGSSDGCFAPADRFPIPVTVWKRPASRNDGRDGAGAAGRNPVAFDSVATMRSVLDQTDTGLEPVDPGSPTGPWIRTDADRLALGAFDYQIRHGVKDDAKAVFGLDRPTARRLESDHVFPYLKSRHVRKFGLTGYDLQLVPQRHAGEDTETALARDAPRTYAYLEQHRDALESRGSSWFDAGPFYNLFGLGAYTWAPYKVVWSRLGFKPDFAVVSTVSDPDVGRKPVVPGDHCMFVATDSSAAAHFVCGLLNASPYQRTLRDVVSGGKASLSKATVSNLYVPRWTASPAQRRIASLSHRAHRIVAEMDGTMGSVGQRDWDDPRDVIRASPLSHRDSESGDQSLGVDPADALDAVRAELDAAVTDVLSSRSVGVNENS